MPLLALLLLLATAAATPALKASLASRAGLRSATPLTPTPNSINVVTDFGADPTGRLDSTLAIQSAINAAWNRSDGFSVEAYHPGGDLGGLVIDFAGGHFLLSKPLRFPLTALNGTGGNVVFANGELVAAPAFTRDGYLLQVDEFVSDDRLQRYRYVTFLNMEFQASHVAAGCVKMMQVEQIRFSLCRFIGFKDKGVWFTGVGNENYIDLCWFQELPGYNQCHNVTAGLKTGTALHIDNNDHSVSNSVMLCSLQGVVVNNSANTFRNVHIYTIGETAYPHGCVHVTASARGIRFLESYFDGCPVFIDEPSMTAIKDSIFLLAKGQASPGLGAVVLSPQQPNYVVDAFSITGAVVIGSPRRPFPFIVVNTTAGNFSATTPPTGTLIADNSFGSWCVGKGLTPSTTRTSRVLTTTNATNEWLFDFSDVLVFPNLHDVMYSVQFPEEAAFTQHALFVDQAALTVTVRTAAPVPAATVTVHVDQSRAYR